MRRSIAALLLLSVLVLSGCGRMPSLPADQAFEQWHDQANEQMADAWSYTLTSEYHPVQTAAYDGHTVAVGNYALPRMSVFHADGTAYDMTKEAAAPAVVAAKRFNDYFDKWLLARQENFEEVSHLARRDYLERRELWQEDYVYTDTVQVAYWNNSHIACLTLRWESFTGGEQSIRSRTALTFDMRTGEAVDINRMVADYPGLQDAVAREILGQIENGKYVEYYNGDVFFDNYRETIPEWMSRSVFFGEKEMTVVFGAYDLAHYNAGEQAFTVSYDLIAPYLNDYGKTVLEIT